jgi:hypothetical protein
MLVKLKRRKEIYNIPRVETRLTCLETLLSTLGSTVVAAVMVLIGVVVVWARVEVGLVMMVCNGHLSSPCRRSRSVQ